MRYAVKELGVQVKCYEEWEADVVKQTADRFIEAGKPGDFALYLEKATWPLFAADEVEPLEEGVIQWFNRPEPRIEWKDVPVAEARVEWYNQVPPPPELDVGGDFY